MMAAIRNMAVMLRNVALSHEYLLLLQTILKQFVSMLHLKVQWAHTIVPFDLTATHDFSGGDDKLCERLTVAVNKLDLPFDLLTDKLLINPLIK